MGKAHAVVCAAARRGTSVLFTMLAVAATERPVAAQTAGSVVGRVVNAQDSTPVAAAVISLPGFNLSTVADSAGRFVIAAVPAGERRLHIERIGFRPQDLDGVVISLGRSTFIEIVLEAAPVTVAGLDVTAQRVRLIEPDVSATREILIGREVRSLPVDRTDEAVNLAPGVSGGHFRGGRIGQEVQVVDGLEVKNQLEASAHGPGLELPPGALEEIEVVTGGLPASYGSALSGAVSYVTRRGSAEQWEGRASMVTDQWAPTSLFRGFTQMNVAAGGPVRFLGNGSTIYVDLLGQGLADAEPRARGLTCLRESDADADAAALIEQVRSTAPALYCPYSGNTLPHEQGDKRIGFARLDIPIRDGPHLTLTALSNRLQRLLYTPEFKYSADAQLGQRSGGAMLSAGLDFSGQGANAARHASVRVGYVRLDRYLGAVDPQSLDGRTEVAGFGLSAYRFLGEGRVRRPIEQQLAEPEAVPGYSAPSGIETPFGPAGIGLFHSAGTPDVANWTRSDALSAEVIAEFIGVDGGMIRTGASARYYQIESYERTFAYLAGSLPAYARFHPASLAGFVDGRLAGDDELNLTVGLRFEAFRSGVQFRQDRNDFLSPVLDPTWQKALMPRFGLALAMPGTDGRTAIRFNYGHVAQAPDFRFFLDTAIGDSIRRAVRRQGNPAISFERGKTYEVAASQMIGRNIGITITGFRKELRDLASGNAQIGSSGLPQYSVNDLGTVNGLEASVRARWDNVSARFGYTLQKATGATGGNDSDSTVTVGSDILELPLAFDQRHAVDLAILAGQAAGNVDVPWSVALTGNAQSGYPLNRLAAAGDTTISAPAYLPWTASIDLRVSTDVGAPPGCDHCKWRIVADGRNLLGLENVLSLNTESGRLAPSASTIMAQLPEATRPVAPIPSESPLYRPRIDVDHDGAISLDEWDAARLAAVLDRHDPSLLIGEARSIRIGIEVTF